MPTNPRKDAFKSVVMSVMRDAGPGNIVSKAELRDAARQRVPEHINDAEPCYPNCDSHKSKWLHEFDRSIYDLTTTLPPKIRSAPNRRGYLLN